MLIWIRNYKELAWIMQFAVTLKQIIVTKTVVTRDMYRLLSLSPNKNDSYQQGLIHLKHCPWYSYTDLL